MADIGLNPVGAIDSVRGLFPMTESSRAPAPSNQAAAPESIFGRRATGVEPAGVASATASGFKQTGPQPLEFRPGAPLPGTGAPQQAGESGRTYAPAAATPAEPKRAAAAGAASAPEQTPAAVSMILYDLQSGIQKAQALIQSVSTELPSSTARLLAAKAYALEIQAQQQIARLHTETGTTIREWYA